MMWYIHGEWNGRWYTRGGYTSEGEARAKAQAMFPQGSHWEVVSLPTRDLQRAKEILKTKDSPSTDGLSISR